MEPSSHLHKGMAARRSRVLARFRLLSVSLYSATALWNCLRQMGSAANVGAGSAEGRPLTLSWKLLQVSTPDITWVKRLAPIQLCAGSYLAVCMSVQVLC